MVREREEENLSEDVEQVLQAVCEAGYEPLLHIDLKPHVLRRPEVAHPGDDVNPGDAG